MRDVGKTRNCSNSAHHLQGSEQEWPAHMRTYTMHLPLSPRLLGPWTAALATCQTRVGSCWNLGSQHNPMPTACLFLQGVQAQATGQQAELCPSGSALPKGPGHSINEAALQAPNQAVHLTMASGAGGCGLAFLLQGQGI